MIEDAKFPREIKRKWKLRDIRLTGIIGAIVLLLALFDGSNHQMQLLTVQWIDVFGVGMGSWFICVSINDHHKQLSRRLNDMEQRLNDIEDKTRIS